MYMPHAKTQEVQQNNHTIIRVDTYKYRLKMPKHNNVKNWLFWFDNFRTIRNSKNSEENPTWTKHLYKTIAHAQSCNTQAKVYEHPMKCTHKPGQRRVLSTTSFLTNYEFVTVIQSNFLNKTFDQSDSRDFLLVNMCVFWHCVQVLKFKTLVRVK